MILGLSWTPCVDLMSVGSPRGSYQMEHYASIVAKTMPKKLLAMVRETVVSLTLVFVYGSFCLLALIFLK